MTPQGAGAPQPVIITVCRSAAQSAPFLVTALRPLEVVACEALPEAGRILARGAARQTVANAGLVLHGAAPGAAPVE